MKQLMFGIENEYAATGFRGTSVIRREELADCLVRMARRHLLHLPDMSCSAGMFTANGSRFYIDCGLHPEWASPECTDPWELVRYIKAGETILYRIAQAASEEMGATSEIMLLRCNVDYSGTGTTWGCHESYLHRSDPGTFIRELIPFLVTRVPYTGAGGFHPIAGWPEFCLAPRLMYIEHVISGDSTGNRGILHTRDEPLAGHGCHRLHLLCGENLYSETAMVLKTGATALAVALADGGTRPGRGLELASPLEDLRSVACDPTCSHLLTLTSGKKLRAIDIQREYLSRTMRHLNILPDWAVDICSLWENVLNVIEFDPEAASTMLDWAIKRCIFATRTARLGFNPGRLHANRVHTLRQLDRFLIDDDDEPDTESFGSTLLSMFSGSRVAPDDRFGVPEEECDMAAFLRTRSDFHQIDTKFGRIGPQGIFTGLDAAGVLDHRVNRVGDIEGATVLPPRFGRARARGNVVAQMSGSPGCSCTWSEVRGAGRFLDLSDPFCPEANWTETPSGRDHRPSVSLPPDPAAEPDHTRLEMLLQRVRTRYARPAHGSAESAGRAARPAGSSRR